MTSSQAGPDGQQVWALTRPRWVLHWLAVALLVAAVALAAVHLAAAPAATAGWVFGVIPLGLLALMTRRVVAVWLDPAEGSVTLFRAAGGAVRTRPENLRRLDHGPLDTYLGAGHFGDGRPKLLRIVANEGTAYLSEFFPHPDELADTLAEHGPQLRDAR